MGVKRGLDLVLAATLLVLLALPIALIGLAVMLDSPGPAFYRCRRVGLQGREFRMLKFRKMREHAAGPPLTVKDDERFTRLGRFLAETKLDELPQLWNVFRGEMSFVGPRPEDPAFVASQAAGYERIHNVRPGITGLCQLAFGKESHILRSADPSRFYVERLLPQKVGIDQVYVAERSLTMDLRILVWTVSHLVLGIDVAVDRRSGRLSIRRRPSSRMPARAASQEQGT